MACQYLSSVFDWHNIPYHNKCQKTDEKSVYIFYVDNTCLTLDDLIYCNVYIYSKHLNFLEEKKKVCRPLYSSLPSLTISRRRLRHPDGQLSTRRDRLFHAALPASPERPQLPPRPRWWLPGPRHPSVPHGQPLSPLLLRRLPRPQRTQPSPAPTPETAAHRSERPEEPPHFPGVPAEPRLLAGRGGRGTSGTVLNTPAVTGGQEPDTSTNEGLVLICKCNL